MPRYASTLATVLVTIVTLLTVATLVAASRDPEPPAEVDTIPEAVEGQVREHARGNTVERIKRVTSHKDTEVEAVYHVDFRGDQGTSSLMLTNTGNLLEIERRINIEDLPPAVRTALTNAFPTATIKEAEAIQVFYYEVEIEFEGRPRDIVLFASGEMYDGPDEDIEDDDDEENQDVSH